MFFHVIRLLSAAFAFAERDEQSRALAVAWALVYVSWEMQVVGCCILARVTISLGRCMGHCGLGIWWCSGCH